MKGAGAYNTYNIIIIRYGKKFMAFFPLDGIKNATNFFPHLIINQSF